MVCPLPVPALSVLCASLCCYTVLRLSPNVSANCHRPLDLLSGEALRLSHAPCARLHAPSPSPHLLFLSVPAQPLVVKVGLGSAGHASLAGDDEEEAWKRAETVRLCWVCLFGEMHFINAPCSCCADLPSLTSLALQLCVTGGETIWQGCGRCRRARGEARDACKAQPVVCVFRCLSPTFPAYCLSLNGPFCLHMFPPALIWPASTRTASNDVFFRPRGMRHHLALTC